MNRTQKSEVRLSLLPKLRYFMLAKGS